MVPVPQSRHAHIAQQLAVFLGGPARKARLVPMIGIFNLGERDDYRVPDGGLLRPGEEAVYLPTAALVVEIVSPDDQTWDKLGFYAAHDVEELLLVDPQERRVHWLALQSGGDYQPIQPSGLIALGPAELAEQIDCGRTSCSS